MLLLEVYLKNKEIIPKIFNGALCISFATLLVKIFGMLYKIPLSYFLGESGMGYFNTAYTIYSFFYIICATGAPKAIAILISEQGEEDKQKDIFNVSLRAYKVIGSLGTIITIIFAYPLLNLLGNVNALLSLLTISPSIFILCLSGVYKGYLHGRVNFFPMAISMIIEAFGKLLFGLAFSYILYVKSASPQVISAGAALGISIGCLVSFLYLKICIKNRNSREISKQSRLLNRKEICLKIAKIALPIAFSSSLASLCGVFEIGILMNCLTKQGLSEIEANSVWGNYSTLALPMINFISAMLLPISTVYLPRLVRIDNTNTEKFEREANNAIYTSVIFALPFSMCFLIYPFMLLDVLFSSNSSILGSELLTMLSPAVLFLSLLTVLNTVLEAKGHIRSSFISMLSTSLIRIVLLLFFLKGTKLGIYAAPLVLSLSYLFGCTISAYFCEKKQIKLKFGLFILKQLLVSAICFIVPYILVFSIGKISLLNVIICLIISFAFYFAFSFLNYKIDPIHQIEQKTFN